jgi:hypothetical protein
MQAEAIHHLSRDLSENAKMAQKPPQHQKDDDGTEAPSAEFLCAPTCRYASEQLAHRLPPFSRTFGRAILVWGEETNIVLSKEISEV